MICEIFIGTFVPQIENIRSVWLVKQIWLITDQAPMLVISSDGVGDGDGVVKNVMWIISFFKVCKKRKFKVQSSHGFPKLP